MQFVPLLAWKQWTLLAGGVRGSIQEPPLNDAQPLLPAEASLHIGLHATQAALPSD